MAFPIPQWVWGIFFSALGGIASNLGVNIQKYSFMKNARRPPEEQTVYHHQPLWVVGLALVIVGAIADFLALGFAAQSIVAPVASITLVANLFFAHLWLEEHLTKVDIWGTILIIAGSITAVAFGDHTERSYTIDQLKDLYMGTAFLIYGVIIAGSVVVLYIVAKRIEPIKLQLIETQHKYDNALREDDAEAAGREDILLAELEQDYSKFQKIHPFCYCAISGMFGGQSLLFGKMVAELVKRTVTGDNQMVYVLTYVFLACMLCTVVCQLHFLALALNFFDALYVVPAFQCFFISVSTVGGMVYFLEFQAFSLLQSALFPLGILITIVGVYILSSRHSRVAKLAARKADAQDREFQQQFEEVETKLQQKQQLQESQLPSIVSSPVPVLSESDGLSDQAHVVSLTVEGMATGAAGAAASASSDSPSSESSSSSSSSSSSLAGASTLLLQPVGARKGKSKSGKASASAGGGSSDSSDSGEEEEEEAVDSSSLYTLPPASSAASIQQHSSSSSSGSASASSSAPGSPTKAKSKLKRVGSGACTNPAVLKRLSQYARRRYWELRRELYGDLVGGEKDGPAQVDPEQLAHHQHHRDLRRSRAASNATELSVALIVSKSTVTMA